MSRYDEPRNRHERFEAWLSGRLLDWQERIAWGILFLVGVALVSLIVAAVIAEHAG